MSALEHAVAVHQAGKIREAAVLYQSILKEDQENADAWHLLGLCHYQLDDFEKSVVLIEKALALNAGSAVFLSNLVLALLKLDQLARAESLARKACEVAPKYVPAHAGLGMCLSRMEREEEAVEAYQTALALEPDHIDSHVNLAKLLRDLRRHEEAISHGQRAVALSPRNPFAHNNLGNLFNDLGRLPEARAHYMQAMDFAPSYGQAWSNWAHTFRFGSPEAAEREEKLLMRLNEAIAEPETSPADRGNMLFALAKSKRDIGARDHAMELYTEGNRLLSPYPFPFEKYEQFLEGIRRHQRRDQLAKAARSHSQEAPIFIVGMLRSGTSLVEQILSCHSSLGGIGERKEVALLTQNLNETGYPSLVDVQSVTLDAMARRYMKRMANFHRTGERPVDKMMTNFLHLGFLSRLFPQAKFIHVTRNPFDVSLSCFFQNFATAPAWAASLDQIGRYCALYREMMSFWGEELDHGIFELPYETLVSEPEPTIRALLEFCRVGWEDACLDHQKSKRAVQTASNWQVRQKLYTSSVARWERYEEHLDDLKQYLGDPRSYI